MERRRLEIEGTVQGVGFRPFAHGLALGLGLTGEVRNDSRGVSIEVEGPTTALERFQERLTAEAPPLAVIRSVRRRSIPPTRAADFRIVESRDGGRLHAGISPDSAPCPECLSELRDPGDRRHGYPFLNCTRCGPRYTIVEALPYDRSRTTMKRFSMCSDCEEEYRSPTDRRFHAQPTACPECGPQLLLLTPGGSRDPGVNPLAAAVDVVRGGGIVGVKGLGGFHLACDASDATAVLRLRKRKGRDAKPFAVMVRDVDTARLICHISPEEEDLLTSPRRPVVLLRRRWKPASAGPPQVATPVAPGLGELGLLLPYTPLHHLLLEAVGRPLVLTSANRSGKPIVYRDEDAPERLGDIVDTFLSHDRPIRTPCDDSVVRVTGSGPLPIRRSRGWVPEPIHVTPRAAIPILGVGGHLKNTVCLLADGRALLSHHVGDLDDLRSRQALQEAVERMCTLAGCRPTLVAHDLHPDYASTRYATSLDGVDTVPVQHHHAHVVSCMAEHHQEGPVIGVAFDGSGAGTDGAVWGGEFLISTRRSFRRAGHLAYRALPGGAAAIREPWRMAVAHLHAALDPGQAVEAEERLLGVAPATRRRVVRQILDWSTVSPPTSSVGRLFDAAAALLGVRSSVDFEAQAAMEMESLAAGVDAEPYPVAFRLRDPGEGDGTDGVWTWDPGPAIRALVEDRLRGIPREVGAAAFHRTVIRAVVEGCRRIRKDTGLSTAVLTGGVFQNRLLLEGAETELGREGFQVLRHRRIPSNDGGLSLGQAVVALARFGHRANASDQDTHMGSDAATDDGLGSARSDTGWTVPTGPEHLQPRGA